MQIENHKAIVAFDRFNALRECFKASYFLPDHNINVEANYIAHDDAELNGVVVMIEKTEIETNETFILEAHVLKTPKEVHDFKIALDQRFLSVELMDYEEGSGFSI